MIVLGLIFGELSIQNWRCYPRQTFDLNTHRAGALVFIGGRNLVQPKLGSNGAGKSTLWNALFWCLYGKTVRQVRPGDQVEPWDEGKKKTSVSLSFERNGHAYIITRTRHPIGLTLTKDGGKPVEVQQEVIDDAVGMSDAIFKQTIFCGQFGDKFLDMKSEAQSQLLTETLDLEMWLEAAEIANKQAAALNIEMLNLHQTLSSLKGRLAQMQEQETDVKSKADMFDKQRKATLAEAASGLRKAEDNLAALQDEKVSKKSKQVVMPEQPKAQMAKRDDLASKVNPLILDHQSYRTKLGDLDRRLSYYQEELRGDRRCPDCGQSVTDKHLKQKIADTEDDREMLQAKSDANEARMLSLQKQMKKLDVEIAEINRDIQDAVAKSLNYRSSGNDIQDKILAAANHVELLQKFYDREKNAVNIWLPMLDELKLKRRKLMTEIKGAEADLEEATWGVDSFKYWSGAFKQIRMKLIDEAMEELGFAANRHAEALGLDDWRIEFTTDRENAAGSITYGFRVDLWPPEANKPIAWENYSGGEGQRWAHAVQFGLSEVLLSRAGISPNIEIYDEPTKHLSQEGIADFIDALADRSRELQRTIFVVDHHSFERGSFDEVLMVERTKKGARIIEA